MKQVIGRIRDSILLLLFAALLLSYPEESGEAVRKGITLCADLLLPSLFPFFVLSSLLIATGFAGFCAKAAGRLMSVLFGVSGSGASAFLLGAVGGYPVGARTLAELAARKDCSQKECARLALFCNNCGPAFFIGAAGVGVFGVKEAGFLLLGANFAASVVIGIALRIFCGKLTDGRKRSASPLRYVSLADAFPGCISNAFSSSLNVCACVILFSVVTALAERSGVLPFCISTLSSCFSSDTAAPLCRSFCMGLLEISTGTAALCQASASPAALPLAAFLLGWGGLSVQLQSLPYWKEAGIRVFPCLLAKLGQGILSALFTFFLMELFPPAIPTMAVSGTLPVPALLSREIVALWGLSGIYFFFFHKKRWKSCFQRFIIGKKN